jgi:hypothetical protein
MVAGVDRVRSSLGCGMDMSAMVTSSVKVRGLWMDGLALVVPFWGEGEDGGEGEPWSQNGVIGLGAGVESVSDWG